jgi:hypothetical protein
MKHAYARLYADPDKAARRLLEHAQAFKPIQEGRIYIEKIHAPSCTATRERPRNMRRASISRFR